MIMVNGQMTIMMIKNDHKQLYIIFFERPKCKSRVNYVSEMFIIYYGGTVVSI